MIISVATKAQMYLDKINITDFVAPLLLRLYLVPVFWMAGTMKLGSMESTIEWFGNPDWGLGLPLPFLMAWIATLTEVVGAVCLFFGFATRWISIPLIITMVVAAVTVHLPNGWLAIAEGGGLFATERTMGAIQRLDRAKEILKDNANYSWLTENGSLVILNNGIEFAATYTSATLIGITGSNGKTTVATMIHKILKDAGNNVALAGNIGKSFAELVATKDINQFVLELSSFQLDGTYNFAPHIAILTNLSPDHLDRYGNDYEKYIASKFKIVMNQTSDDYFIYDADDLMINKWISNTTIKSQLIPFSLQYSFIQLAI